MASGVLSAFIHLAGAIVCAAAGLIIWDIGTRSPAHVLADAMAGVHSRHSLVRGIVRFLIGLIFIAMSVALVFLSLPDSEFDRYREYQIGAFITALAVELLIGNEVRLLLGVGKGTRGA